MKTCSCPLEGFAPPALVILNSAPRNILIEKYAEVEKNAPKGSEGHEFLPGKSFLISLFFPPSRPFYLFVEVFVLRVVFCFGWFSDKVPAGTRCTFENGWCGWRNSTDKHHTLKWKLNRGPTRNKHTGPRHDHTFANSTGTTFIFRLWSKRGQFLLTFFWSGGMQNNGTVFEKFKKFSVLTLEKDGRIDSEPDVDWISYHMRGLSYLVALATWLSSVQLFVC